MRVPAQAARDLSPPSLQRSRWDTQPEPFNAHSLKSHARCRKGLFDRLLHSAKSRGRDRCHDDGGRAGEQEGFH